MLQHIVPKTVAALMLIACLALSWRVWSGSITLVFSVISVFTIYMLMPQHSTKFLQLISKDSMGITFSILPCFISHSHTGQTSIQSS